MIQFLSVFYFATLPFILSSNKIWELWSTRGLSQDWTAWLRGRSAHLLHFFLHCLLPHDLWAAAPLLIKIHCLEFSMIIHIYLPEPVCLSVDALHIYQYIWLSVIDSNIYNIVYSILFHRLSKLWKTTTVILSMPLWWVFCAAIKYLL